MFESPRTDGVPPPAPFFTETALSARKVWTLTKQLRHGVIKAMVGTEGNGSALQCPMRVVASQASYRK